MAKKLDNTDTGTQDDNIPKPVVKAIEDYLDGKVEASDPIRDVAMALIAVAKGASVVELRKVVVENVPEDRGLYVTQIRRMRDAADTALTLAQELASGV